MISVNNAVVNAAKLCRCSEELGEICSELTRYQEVLRQNWSAYEVNYYSEAICTVKRKLKSEAVELREISNLVRTAAVQIREEEEAAKRAEEEAAKRAEEEARRAAEAQRYSQNVAASIVAGLRFLQ